MTDDELMTDKQWNKILRNGNTPIESKVATALNENRKMMKKILSKIEAEGC